MSREESPIDTEDPQDYPIRLSLGPKFKVVRLHLGMGQKEFGATIGIRQGYLSELERGLKAPSETLVTALIYRYKINPDWLSETSDTAPMFIEEAISSGANDQIGDIAAQSQHALGSYDRFRAIFQKVCQDLGVPELFQIVERASGTISDQFRRYNEGQIGDKDLYAILSRQVMSVLKFISTQFR